MKTVCSVKIKKLAKYEKEWRRRVEEERQAIDPATRFQAENKKLIADNMRSVTALSILVRQSINQISGRSVIICSYLCSSFFSITVCSKY
jgi:hypothetical protein